jgi:stage IV sporulation protein FB
MLRFTLFGFPIVVHWIFWVNMALIGGAIGARTPEAMQALLVWVLAGFASVLIHELGHAFAMRRYGDRYVGVMLYAFGGFARGSRRLTRRQDFVVSLAGPLVQIVAGILVWWLFDLLRPEPLLVRYFLSSFISVSLFWAILNLLPIIPLDGGHISRALFGPRRLRWALLLSLICSVAMVLVALDRFGLIAVLFFGMFAFNNWKELRGEPQVPWMMDR